MYQSHNLAEKGVQHPRLGPASVGGARANSAGKRTALYRNVQSQAMMEVRARRIRVCVRARVSALTRARTQTRMRMFRGIGCKEGTGYKGEITGLGHAISSCSRSASATESPSWGRTRPKKKDSSSGSRPQKTRLRSVSVDELGLIEYEVRFPLDSLLLTSNSRGLIFARKCNWGHRKTF
jgi:hypothetical protein